MQLYFHPLSLQSFNVVWIHVTCILGAHVSRLLKFLFLVEIFNPKMWLASPGDFIPAQLKRKYFKSCFKAPDKMFIFQIWTSDMNTELEGGRRRSWLKVWQYGTKAKLTQEDTNSNNIMGCIPSSEEAPEVWILHNFTFVICLELFGQISGVIVNCFGS